MVLVDFGDSYSMIIRFVSMSDDRNLQSYLLFYVNDWIFGDCFLLCLTLTTDNQLAMSLGIWDISSAAHIFSVVSRKKSDIFKIFSHVFSETCNFLSDTRLLFALSSQMNHLNAVFY